jgi:hypothetical protein
MSLADQWVQDHFPNLRNGQYKITSEFTEDYNCLAWTAGETDRRWDPTDPSHYWPEGVDRNLTLTVFMAAYATRGYEQCSNGQLEQGYEKIAIYANQYGCQHAARQLGSRAWTSKLGDGWDIEHPTLQGVENTAYGTVVAFMKRPI